MLVPELLNLAMSERQSAADLFRFQVASHIDMPLDGRDTDPQVLGCLACAIALLYELQTLVARVGLPVIMRPTHNVQGNAVGKGLAAIPLNEPGAAVALDLAKGVAGVGATEIVPLVGYRHRTYLRSTGSRGRPCIQALQRHIRKRKLDLILLENDVLHGSCSVF